MYMVCVCVYMVTGFDIWFLQHVMKLSSKAKDNFPNIYVVQCNATILMLNKTAETQKASITQ
jgi:hypothetical protein